MLARLVSFIIWKRTLLFYRLLLGLIVITKSVISDIADDSNLAVGLSLIFSANNLGYIIGPSMAGKLNFVNIIYLLKSISVFQKPCGIKYI